MKSYFVKQHNAVLRFQDIGGEKLPILFIHGLGCASTSDYLGVVANPSIVQHRCILVDLFGAGFSDHPENFTYTVEDHANILVELVNSIQLTKFVIFGHSAGGAIAIALAAKCQNRVEALILAEPNLDSGGGFYSRNIAKQPLCDYLAHGHRQQICESIANQNYNWAGTMGVSDPLAVHKLSESLVVGSVPSWRDQLLSFSMPRKVLFGEYSLPDDDYAGLPMFGMEVAMIPKAGHSMLWENPVAVAQEISIVAPIAQS